MQISLSRGRLALIVVLSVVIGWAANDWMSPQQKKRPVLNFIKNWWWVPLLLDKPAQPTDTSYHDSCHESDQVGPDGYRIVHHGRAL